MINYIFIFIFHLLLTYSIYHALCDSSKKEQILLSSLATILPIIALIVTFIIIKKVPNYNINRKSVVCFILAIVTLVSFSFYYGVDKHNSTNEDMYLFVDEAGEVYTYDFEKTGFEYIYSQDKNIKLRSDLCYLDSNDKLVFDEKMDIFAVGYNHCEDDENNKYYPINYIRERSNGVTKCDWIDNAISYDRLGKAYTYKYVPYYDEEGQKYSYSYDSKTQKGYYTNVETSEQFDNEYSYVDESGYFVYDYNNEFVKQEESNKKIYKDSKNKTYYWASSITWDKNGKMIY